MQILNDRLLEPLRDSKLLPAALTCFLITAAACLAMGPTTCPPVAGPMAATLCFAFMTVVRDEPEDVLGHAKDLAAALAVLALVDVAQLFCILPAVLHGLTAEGFFLASLATAAFAVLACAVGLLLEANPLTGGFGMAVCASGLLNGPLIWLVHPFRDDGPSHVGYLEPIAHGWPLVLTVVLALGVFLLAAGAAASHARALRLSAELRATKEQLAEDAEKEETPKQSPYRPRPYAYSPGRTWAKPETDGGARSEVNIEEILGRRAGKPKAKPEPEAEQETKPEPESNPEAAPAPEPDASATRVVNIEEILKRKVGKPEVAPGAEATTGVVASSVVNIEGILGRKFGKPEAEGPALEEPSPAAEPGKED